MNLDLYHWLTRSFEDNRSFCVSSPLFMTKEDQDFLDELLPWVFDEVELNLPKDIIHTLVAENPEFNIEYGKDLDREEKGARKLEIIPNSKDLMRGTMEALNPQLEPYGIELFWPTLICNSSDGVCPHLHTDGAGLEARLNFYGYQGGPGSVLWFSESLPQDRPGKRLHLEPDIMEKYPFWKYMREGGDDWSKVPEPLYDAITTGLRSAWVNPNCIHTVVNGGGVRITPSLKVRNINPDNKFDYIGAWTKVLEFIDGN